MLFAPKKGLSANVVEILETERTILRPFCHDDMVRLNGLYKDPQVIKYKGTLSYSKDRVKNILEAFIRHQTSFGFSMWAVYAKSDAQFLGRAGLIHLGRSEEVDLSYAYHKRFWGLGYGQEIAQAVVEWGFSNIDTDFLTAFVHPKNFGSIKILEKTGFIFERNKMYHRQLMRLYKLYRH